MSVSLAQRYEVNRHYHRRRARASACRLIVNYVPLKRHWLIRCACAIHTYIHIRTADRIPAIHDVRLQHAFFCARHCDDRVKRYTRILSDIPRRCMHGPWKTCESGIAEAGGIPDKGWSTRHTRGVRATWTQEARVRWGSGGRGFGYYYRPIEKSER